MNPLPNPIPCEGAELLAALADLAASHCRATIVDVSQPHFSKTKGYIPMYEVHWMEIPLTQPELI